ncbi:MAG: hypothetical protein KY412_05220 [Actinobacteria bacterium]|nr:hypothetical protein [Actinomycetota bacterium]
MGSKEPSHQDQVDDKGEVPPQAERENLGPDEMRAPGGSTPRGQLETNQMTTWDGAGNPIKHVFAEGKDGHLTEGTGADTQEAKDNAKANDTVLGPDASPGAESEGGGPGEPLG